MKKEIGFQTMKKREWDFSKPFAERGVTSNMRAKFLNFLQYAQNNLVFISKWSAITSIVLTLIVSVMSLSIQNSGRSVSLSLLPVLLAAAAWSVANAAKAPKSKLFAILALWISLGGVFVAHFQFQRLLVGYEMKKQTETVQNEQK